MPGVAVASGVGGRGKTMVAVSLALAATHDAGVPVTLLDCDVEGPNAHLFLPFRSERRHEVGVPVPEVDASRCDLCRRCAEVCAYHAVAVLEDRVLVFEELCHGCGSCARQCPTGAIAEWPRATGFVESGWAGAVRLACGELNVGEATSVPVTRAVKRAGRAEKRFDLVIVDSPPGTSCPVVESLRGAGAVVLVTEPTPFGLHDLQMAVTLARDELGLPVMIVVNRDGAGDDGVDRYCREQNLPIVLRIPLSRDVARACSEGIPLVAALPEYPPPFQELARRLAARLWA